MDDYVDDRVKKGINIQKIDLLSPLRRNTSGQTYREVGYLAVYVAAQVVVQTYPDIFNTLDLFVNEEGPLFYLQKSNWYFVKAINFLLSNRTDKNGNNLYAPWKMIKFTGQSRDAILNRPNATTVIQNIYNQAIEGQVRGA